MADGSRKQKTPPKRGSKLVGEIDSSVRSRVEKSEQEKLATNSVIPPAEMPPR